MGEYILPATGAPRTVRPPVALMYDGATAANPMDPATGLYLEVHPVDQQVELALLITQGKISSAPNVGNKLRTIKKISISTPAQARDFVRQALATLVSAKAIKILSIEVKATARTGALAVVVNYTNLRSGRTQPVKTVLNG